jgi:hypothetical protein
MRRKAAVNLAADEAAIEYARRTLEALEDFEGSVRGKINDYHMFGNARRYLECCASFDPLMLPVPWDTALPGPPAQPSDIRTFLYELLARGERRLTYERRDEIIARVVLKVSVEYGLRPKRGRDVAAGDKWQSACSIVQKALAGMGLPLSEVTIESIWDAWRQRLMDEMRQQ